MGGIELCVCVCGKALCSCVDVAVNVRFSLCFEDKCYMQSSVCGVTDLECCCCLVNVVRMEGYFHFPDMVVISLGAGWYLDFFFGVVCVRVCLNVSWVCMGIVKDGFWVVGFCEVGVVCGAFWGMCVYVGVCLNQVVYIWQDSLFSCVCESMLPVPFLCKHVCGVCKGWV